MSSSYKFPFLLCFCTFLQVYPYFKCSLARSFSPSSCQYTCTVFPSIIPRWINACFVQTPGVFCPGMLKNAGPRTRAILSMLEQTSGVGVASKWAATSKIWVKQLLCRSSSYHFGKRILHEVRWTIVFWSVRWTDEEKPTAFQEVFSEAQLKTIAVRVGGLLQEALKDHI